MLENITLSQKQQQIILGGLLGDSYCNKTRGLIRFSQSVKQEEYLKWKYSFFYGDNVSKIYTRIYQQGYIGKSFELYNKNHCYDSLLLFISDNLYSNEGRKKISLKYLSQIDDLGLAIWWLDDGCLSIHKGNRYGKLCTECFNYEEHILLQEYFKNRWGIDVHIKVEKNKYYFLHFNVCALKKLITIIFKYVVQIPSMIYKIDMQYTNYKYVEDFKEVYDYIQQCKFNDVLMESTLTTAGC